MKKKKQVGKEKSKKKEKEKKEPTPAEMKKILDKMFREWCRTK